MKITYNWLKDFVDIDITAQELAKKLTSAGMEVEEIIYQNKHLHDVVVGKILKIERHPQADKLVVCQVDIGRETTQIITAATNVFEGAVVPVSLPGADLINGVKIQKSKLRGIDSCGMFCSGAELGIDETYFQGASVDGILILPNDMKIGLPISQALMLDDIVYDVNVTPNRPDCMSVIGLAREVCAVLGRDMKKVNLNYPIDIYSKDTIHDYIDVEKQTMLCHRYMMGAVTNVKIERSPLWMRARLNAVGIKPINTIVDITNYVLIEMGQPLHAFDKSLVGEKIIVRQAQNGEEIEVLNHNKYKLDNNDIVIADETRPLVIGGVIGGTNSSISNDTKICLFESAVFDLKSIRITSRKIGVRTDSSARNEKGVNVANAELGLNRALHLVSKLGCGRVVRGLIDKKTLDNPPRTIVCSVNKITKILGVDIPANKMLKILNALAIATTVSGDKLTCIVPPFREDVQNDYDLAEEVIRLYGYDVYDSLDAKLFDKAKVTAGGNHNRLAFERRAGDMLIDYGFFETVNYTLCPSSSCDKLLIDDERANMIKILNPISEEMGYLRTSLAHSLFSCLNYNLSVGNKDLRIYECGCEYLAKELPLVQLPNEKHKIAIAVSEEDFDFFAMKGIVENVLSLTSLDYSLVRTAQPYLHNGVGADVKEPSGNTVASFGKIHPLVAKNYDLPTECYYAEIDSDFLSELPIKRFKVKTVPKFPIVDRDIAIVVDEKIEVDEILKAVKSSCGKNFYGAKLFDVYRSDKLEEGKKSLAFNVRLFDENKTLNDSEVNALINKILKALSFRFGAVLR